MKTFSQKKSEIQMNIFLLKTVTKFSVIKYHNIYLTHAYYSSSHICRAIAQSKRNFYTAPRRISLNQTHTKTIINNSRSPPSGLSSHFQ